MKKLLIAVAVIIFVGVVLQSQAQDASLKVAIEKYDQAVRGRDVEAVKSLLAPDVLLYEHSVRNDGLQDVFENHLKPEILESKDLQLDFSDVRVTPGTDLALVTRQYRIRGEKGDKVIDATGNETMAWKKVNSQWKISHIHYSHACPKPPVPTK